MLKVCVVRYGFLTSPKFCVVEFDGAVIREVSKCVYTAPSIRMSINIIVIKGNEYVGSARVVLILSSYECHVNITTDRVPLLQIQIYKNAN